MAFGMSLMLVMTLVVTKSFERSTPLSLYISLVPCKDGQLRGELERDQLDGNAEFGFSLVDCVQISIMLYSCRVMWRDEPSAPSR